MMFRLVKVPADRWRCLNASQPLEAGVRDLRGSELAIPHGCLLQRHAYRVVR
jgi:hypothetical protein